jgi:hypothetical protein
LAGGADLMVRALDMQAHAAERGDHLVTNVSEVIDRGNREVSALVRSLVTEVAALFLAA